MRIAIKVKPNSKNESVEKISDSEFSLRVKAPAKEGKANDAAIKLLSKYFEIPKSRLSIIKGHGSRNKLIEVIN